MLGIGYESFDLQLSIAWKIINTIPAIKTWNASLKRGTTSSLLSSVLDLDSENSAKPWWKWNKHDKHQQQGWWTSQKTMGVLKKMPWVRLRHLCPQLLGRSNGVSLMLLMGRIRRGPVERGSLSHYLWWVLYIPGGSLGFLNHQQYQRSVLGTYHFFELSSMLCFNDSLELDIEESLRSSFLLNCLVFSPFMRLANVASGRGPTRNINPS